MAYHNPWPLADWTDVSSETTPQALTASGRSVSWPTWPACRPSGHAVGPASRHMIGLRHGQPGRAALAPGVVDPLLKAGSPREAMRLARAGGSRQNAPLAA